MEISTEKLDNGWTAIMVSGRVDADICRELFW